MKCLLHVCLSNAIFGELSFLSFLLFAIFCWILRDLKQIYIFVVLFASAPGILNQTHAYPAS